MANACAFMGIYIPKWGRQEGEWTKQLNAEWTSEPKPYHEDLLKGGRTKKKEKPGYEFRLIE